jgi:hypothetical protein
MFFGLRKRQEGAGGVSHPSDPAWNGAETRQSWQWHAWRCAAQKVARSWNEWLAAEGREHAELYACYIAALAEEERAATEVESLVNVGAMAQQASDCWSGLRSSSGGQHFNRTLGVRDGR